MEVVDPNAAGPTRIGFPTAVDPTLVRALLIAAATYAAIMAAYAIVDFRPVVSDAAKYLQWSESPASLDRAHLPGYPVVLWVFRAATGGGLRGDALTLSVTFAAWLAGIIYVWAILDRLAPTAREIGALLFALFPFTGVTYVAIPVADTFGILLLLVSIHAATMGKWWSYIVAAGFGMLVHKGLWPFFGLLSVAVLWSRPAPPWRILAAAAPLLAYTTWGVLRGETIFWVAESNLAEGLVGADGPAIPFYGIVGTMLTGGGVAILKAGILAAVVLTDIWLIWFFWRRRAPLLLAVAVAELALAAFIEVYSAWAVVRFARIMALPLAVALVVPAGRLLSRPRARALCVAALVSTQFGYAYYCYLFFRDR